MQGYRVQGSDLTRPCDALELCGTIGCSIGPMNGYINKFQHPPMSCAQLLMLICVILMAQVSSVQSQDSQTADAVQTGDRRDAVVAPVRRVFPKTPSDRDLRRLIDGKKTARKSNKK